MIYVTGDTHGDMEEFEVRMFDHRLNEDDTLIICGDFGFDWNDSMIKEWREHPRKFTTLFCDGNHENYDVLNSLPLVEKFGDVVGDFGNNTYRLLTGHMYTIEDKRFFVFGGAASIDKAWRIEEENIERYGKLWWEEEVPTDKELALAEQTLEDNNYEFDYFISHTCRVELKEMILGQYNSGFFDPTEVMIQNLEILIRDHGKNWKDSYFGHFHMDENYGRYHCLYDNVEKIK